VPTGLTGRAVAQERGRFGDRFKEIYWGLNELYVKWAIFLRSRFGDRFKEMYWGLNEPYVKWAIFIMLGVSPRQPIQSSIHVHFVHLNLI
jgi:hypothetical protein